MKIGELARTAGVPPSTIRFYEAEGLLPRPPRTSGRRDYDESAVLRLRLVLVAQQIGFTLRETKALVAGVDRERPARATWSVLVDDKLVEIESAMKRLRAMRTLLREARDCRCISLESCRMLGRVELARSNEHRVETRALNLARKRRAR
jgi:DNA-binding transcriptional MerR regulator